MDTTNTVFFEYAIDDFPAVSLYMQALGKRGFHVMNEPREDTPYTLIIMFSAQYVRANINVGSIDLRRRPSRIPDHIVVIRLDATTLPPYLAIFDTIFAVNMMRVEGFDGVIGALAIVLRSKPFASSIVTSGATGVPTAASTDETTPTTPIENGIFLSHHHSPAEDAFTSRLYGDLVAACADVWMDDEQIGYGDITDKINEGLKGRQWLLFVMTPASLRSHWVNKEVNAGLSKVDNKSMRAVIPIIAEPCDEVDIPALWLNLHRYDTVTKGYVQEINRLMKNLRFSYRVTDTN